MGSVVPFTIPFAIGTARRFLCIMGWKGRRERGACDGLSNPAGGLPPRLAAGKKEGVRASAVSDGSGISCMDISGQLMSSPAIYLDL